MIILSRILEMLILPPGLTLLLVAAGLLLLRRHARLAWGLMLTGLLALYILSIPRTADLLVTSLERHHPPLDEAGLRAGRADAIVILGSGRYPAAPEYGGRDTLSGGALIRVRYGAWVHRMTGVPVLVTGGSPYGEAESEAVLMQRVLEQEFQVPVNWVEGDSRTTEENARFSAAILEKEGLKRILLVTHALHMRRAVASFRKFGLEVIPAPTQFRVRSTEERFSDWLPGDGSMARVALHEHLGYLWYGLKGAL